jgi:hypothetical protein
MQHASIEVLYTCITITALIRLQWKCEIKQINKTNKIKYLPPDSANSFPLTSSGGSLPPLLITT